MNSDRDKASPGITIGSDNIFADLGLENVEKIGICTPDLLEQWLSDNKNRIELNGMSKKEGIY